MPKDLPPPELLRKLLRYEPETGKLFWKERPVEMFSSTQSAVSWNGRYAGKEAFTYKTPNGYLRGSVFDRPFLKHRVIWAVVTGHWPKHELDHINGVRTDNRWANLREATSSQNKWNAKLQKRNKSGYKGVSWHTKRQKWRATICRFGATHHLGYFDCPQKAYDAYCHAAQKLYGEFANPETKKTGGLPMTIHEIVNYLQDEMPDEMAPETLAAFVMTVVTGYLGDPEAAIKFLRAVVESAEGNMDKIMEDFNDVAGEP